MPVGSGDDFGAKKLFIRKCERVEHTSAAKSLPFFLRVIKLGQSVNKTVDHRKRLTLNIVFLLSSLSAVLSMAVHIFIALLLHLKTQQEFLTAQATLKHNEFVCRTKGKPIAVKKARALLSRPGWASQTVYMRKSCVAYPGYPTCPTCPGELSRHPELSLPPHVNG